MHWNHFQFTMFVKFIIFIYYFNILKYACEIMNVKQFLAKNIKLFP